MVKQKHFYDYAQRTLLDTFIQQPFEEKESFDQLQERFKGQKAKILDLLQQMDRVPVYMLRGQYNARINELNKELSACNPPMQITSEYDPEEGEYFKRLEVLQIE